MFDGNFLQSVRKKLFFLADRVLFNDNPLQSIRKCFPYNETGFPSLQANFSLSKYNDKKGFPVILRLFLVSL